MREAVPEMKSAIVAGVGHAPMLDEPEAVAAIDAFLAGLRPLGGEPALRFAGGFRLDGGGIREQVQQHHMVEDQI